MDYGLCLPNFPAGASGEGMEAAAEPAAALGFSTVWTTDHVLVDHESADDYGHIYDAILTLAWVGARQPDAPARDERHRRPAAQRGRAGQGARHARRR